MTTNVIANAEIEGLKVASLPTNPTAHTSYGGLGYNANQMKAAFDALPLFIIERFNSLINDIKNSSPQASISADIKTGIYQAPNLATLFADIISGAFASYLMVGEYSLANQIAMLKSDIEDIRAAVGLSYE